MVDSASGCFQVIKSSMWVLLEFIMFGSLLLYSTVSCFRPTINNSDTIINQLDFIHQLVHTRDSTSIRVLLT